MAFKVRIKNFQKIKTADLSFDPGLTIIVGATNNGKTAILRAIEAALFNKSVDSSISYGSDYSGVAISYENNLLVWKRNKTKASKTTYKLNDNVMVKAGRGQLDEVRDAFNIKEISLLHTREKLNFWKQMRFPFLLDRTPAQLFEFIVMSSEETNLAEVLKFMNSDMKEISGSIQIAESVIDDYKEKITSGQEDLKRFIDYPIISKEIINKDSSVKILLEIENLSNKCRELSIEISSNKVKLSKIDKDRDVVEDLISLLEDGIIEEKFLEGSIVGWEKVMNEKIIFSIKRDKIQDEINTLRIVSKLDIDAYLIKEKEAKEIEDLLFNQENVNVACKESSWKLAEVNKEISEVKIELEEFKICPLCGQKI